MPKVMSFGNEKWIVKYCPECKQWIKATPDYFPVANLKLTPVCLKCVAKQQSQSQVSELVATS